jgi:hypothetical protein
MIRAHVNQAIRLEPRREIRISLGLDGAEIAWLFVRVNGSFLSSVLFAS